MKRIAFEDRWYDYSTKEEALEHQIEMADKGWYVVEEYPNDVKGYWATYTVHYSHTR